MHHPRRGVLAAGGVVSLQGGHLPLTPGEQRVLLHLRGQALVTGRVPTCRELAAVVGVTYGYVHQVMEILIHKGWIARDYKLARGLRFVDPPQPAAAVA